MMTAANPRAASTKSAAPPDTTPALSAAAEAAPTVAKAVSDKLEKLGVRRRLDLVLHLPLRYEDETRLARLAQAMSGETVQLECEVEHTSVQFRPKRTLVCRVRDGDEILHLRFFNFYPSQQKQLAPGTRVRPATAAGAPSGVGRGTAAGAAKAGLEVNRAVLSGSPPA